MTEDHGAERAREIADAERRERRERAADGLEAGKNSLLKTSAAARP
jgi:hypothetical protein